MTAAERRAAQKDLQDLVGEHSRALTDALNTALTDGLYPIETYPDGLPTPMRRVLSTTQIAAQAYPADA